MLYGKAVFTLDNKELVAVNLIVDSDVDKINIFTMTKKTVYNWINLLR